jgi:hypothetical protein
LGGALVLDDAEGDIQATFHDLEGRPTRTEMLTQVRAARVSVQE